MNENINHNLCKLWDRYAEAGYDKADLTHSTKHLRKTMANLFANSVDSDKVLNHAVDVIDLGCGAGGMFPAILERIRPANLAATDRAEQMLAKAQRRAETIRDRAGSNMNFTFSQLDLTDQLPWANDTFDVVVSNLVICYLPGGWNKPLRESCRILKPNGWLYLSTFINTWNMSSAPMKIAWKEFVHAPVGSLYGIKLWRFMSGIDREAKRQRAEYPDPSELLAFLNKCSIKVVETEPVYYGFGLAIAAQKQPQVNTTA